MDNAKCDLDYMLSQSSHTNHASETSKHLMKMKNARAMLSSSSSQNSYAVKTSNLVRRQDHILGSEEMISSGGGRGTHTKVYIPENRISISENLGQNGNGEASNKEHLSEDDLKWLGKNYSINGSGKAIFKNMKSKLDCETRSGRPTPPLPRKSEENESSIHKTATDLINRVQVREQQLWRQLSEMSLTSVPSFSSSTGKDLSLESYRPPLNYLSEEKIAVKDILDLQNCTEISSTSLNNRIPTSTENIVSLLGEEWLNNLLRAELGISEDERR
ncbi:hypothetical protein DAPPUDRAFT_228679 [Daphnia pulex]|uniref:Uncharacterized protein n=1 Tax=Daphnia pulex TaxID=6669 RepID=E9HFS6_DAPPU|nr:hypothetical protein DAPPUDRAFT_228679 [Daphnia pulex]|eukprot:EFX69419.1 hypothetical protein DAPPUDRAFT_228679 [Daphnia pulex]